MAKNRTVPEVSKMAVEESVKEYNTRKAEELGDKLFGSRYKNIEELQIFVPTYYMLTLKERFYERGGKAVQAYSISDYAQLMDIPEESVNKLVDNSPQFFVFLHERRTINQEIDMLLTRASRQLINSMQSASVRDQASAISALSKFSSLVSPKKQEGETFDDLLGELKTPEEIIEVAKSYGFVKTDIPTEDLAAAMEEEVSPVESPSESLQTLQELMGTEEEEEI